MPFQIVLTLTTIAMFHLPPKVSDNKNEPLGVGGTQMEHKQQQMNLAVLQVNNITTLKEVEKTII